MTRLIPAALLSLLLAGCSVSVGAPSATPTPAPPRVLLDISGKSIDYTSRTFHAERRWHAVYHADCQPVALDPNSGVFQILGVHARHPNGYEEVLLYTRQKSPDGASDSAGPGTWKLRILTEAGCSWHVQAQEPAL